MARENLMTAREVATYLNCSAATIRRMAARGEIPHYRLGKLVRFRSGDVEAWLSSIHSGTVTSAPSAAADTNQLSLFSDGAQHA
jgi:excisionase family DNA binding protein